jgi:hypothetical protein
VLVGCECGGPRDASASARERATLGIFRFRAGVVANHTLIFGKVGLGVAHTKDSFLWTGSGMMCTNNGALGCLASAPVPSDALMRASWNPSLLIGGGLERNFGMFFVRGSAELEAVRNIAVFAQTGANYSAAIVGTGTSAPVQPNNSDFYWTARVVGMVGVRF